MARQLKECVVQVTDHEALSQLVPEFKSWGMEIGFIYRHCMFGFSAKMSGLLIKNYLNDPRILGINESKDFVMSARQADAPIHLDRIDQRAFPLSGQYTYSLDGTGVTAYVVDSGFSFGHIEFGGRISAIPDSMMTSQAFDPFFDALPQSQQTANQRGFDSIGHGTHVCGIIGSTTYGVAKNITIKSAKVFGSTGTTTTAIIIAGIDSVLAEHIDAGSPPAVCNMSFGSTVAETAQATLLEIAVSSLVTAGISVIVAAGNQGINANMMQPARMAEVLAVGSVDDNDKLADFTGLGDLEDIESPIDFGFATSTKSNFGSVVEIFAPGISVVSTGIGSDRSVNTFSGTSMSAAIVCGVAALIVDNTPALAPNDVLGQIIANATFGIVTELPIGTPNRMIYSVFVDDVIEWQTSAGPLGSFKENRTIEIQLSAIGFTGQTVQYSLLSGALPTGIVLDSIKGTLSGFTPAISSDQTFNFTIRASGGGLQTDRAFSLIIEDASLIPVWSTSTDLGSVEEGETFSIQLSAQSRNGVAASSLVYSKNSITPFNWTISSTGLIEGVGFLNLNRDNLIELSVSVSDGIDVAFQTFKLLVTQRFEFGPPGEPRWITPVGNIGTVTKGISFSFFIQAVNDDGEPLPSRISYHIFGTTHDGSTFGPSGELPPGIGLDQDTGEIFGIFTGVLTEDTEVIFDGNPVTLTETVNNKVFEFAIYAFDGANLVVRLFNLNVIAIVTNEKPTWLTPPGILGTVDSFEFANFIISADDPDSHPSPLRYTLFSGLLPPGTVLDPFTGRIQGTAEFVKEDTNFVFVIQVSDDDLTAERTFVIKVTTVDVPPEWINPSGSIGELNEGEAFDFTFGVINLNEDTFTFLVVGGSLPPGLSLDENKGRISGIAGDVPSDTTFIFTIQVSDGITDVNREFSIKIFDGLLLPGVAPVWVTPAGLLSVAAVENVQYFFQLEATDDPTEILTYEIVGGALPNGMALNKFSGGISGLANDSNTMDNTLFFEVSVSDGFHSVIRSFSIFVTDTDDLNVDPIWITPSGSLGSYTESLPMSYQLVVHDINPNDVLILSVKSGTLPPGTSVSSETGIIDGIPNAVLADITFNFFLEADDQRGGKSVRFYTITILNV